MFKKLKVVELASVLAGPLVGSFFAELGAEVVKIENKNTGGDVTRNWKLPSESKEHLSAYYIAANFGKKSVFLDFTNKHDYSKAIELIAHADIVIANFKHGDAEKLQLDYETLKEINPEVVYAELTGFGIKNNRTAYDVVLQAESGFLFMNGNPNELPVKMPVALIDVLAAHHLKEAILCALWQKATSKNGKFISISLYECALASLANQATNWLVAGHIPQAMGTQHPNIAPYGDLFFTADNKMLVLAIGSDGQFKKFCEVLNASISAVRDIDGGNNLNGELFSNNVKRVENRELLVQEILAIIKLKTASFWNDLFIQNNIPFGIVKQLDEVFSSADAQQMIQHFEADGRKVSRVKTALV